MFKWFTLQCYHMTQPDYEIICYFSQSVWRNGCDFTSNCFLQFFQCLWVAFVYSILQITPQEVVAGVKIRRVWNRNNLTIRLIVGAVGPSLTLNLVWKILFTLTGLQPHLKYSSTMKTRCWSVYIAIVCSLSFYHIISPYKKLENTPNKSPDEGLVYHEV